MVTPEGSQADSSIVVPIRRSPIEGAPTYNMAVHDDRITLWKRQEKGQGDGWEQVATIPCAITRYKGNDGLVHVLPDSTGDTHHATSDDIADGKTWRRIGAVVPRAHREAAEFALRQVAEATGPVVTISPNIMQGVPPLAPPLGPTYGMDAEVGRQAWAWLADRLAPHGRLTVGAAIMAPFLQEAGSVQTLWTMWGNGGFGKTLLLDSCASIYGEKSKWRRTFNTTAVGLTSVAQRLSYFPVMLDETQGVTSSLSAALTPIITGAVRTRSTRSGALAESNGSWHSLAFLTSNPPLRDALDHEMWDRRLIEVEAKLLWQPRPASHAEESAWWADIATSHRKMQGWAWSAMRKQHCASPELVEQWMRHVNTTVAQPGQGNIGRITQLAIAGCQWFAEWTGNPVWAEGVVDAAASICADVEELKTDDARDAAQALVDHRAMYQEMWNGVGTRGETFAYPEAGGYDGSCNVTHEHSCEWVAILPEAWKKILPELPVARVRNTDFGLVLAPGNDGKHLARKWRVPSHLTSPSSGRNLRAYVVCWKGVEQLAWPDPEAPTTPPTAGGTTPPPVTGPPVLPNADTQSQAHTEANAVPAPVQRAEPEFCSFPALGDAVVQDTDRLSSWVASALDSAVSKGYNDVTMHMTCSAEAVAQAGWDTTKFYDKSGVIVRESDGTKIMLRRHAEPDKYAAALKGFYIGTKSGVGRGLEIGYTPAGFGVKLLREMSKKAKEDNPKRREPRWHLPKDVDLPETRNVALPAVWRKAGEGDLCFDRNKAHLPAFTQAHLAPLWFGVEGEKFVHYTESEIPEVSPSLAGVWRITVPMWDPRLPSPVAGAAPGTVRWVTTDIMRLYQSMGVMPETSEAWLAPSHKIADVADWAAQIRSWLDTMKGTPAAVIPKMMYQSFAGRIYSQWSRGNLDSVYRPDWGWAIQNTSWCLTVRYAYEVAEHTGIYPTAVLTDAIYYPADSNVPVYQPVRGEKRRVGAIPLGDDLGHFTLKSGQ